jgi:hypothetical protein
MVTGVRVEADVEGTEPIVKTAIAQSAMTGEKNLFRGVLRLTKAKTK